MGTVFVLIFLDAEAVLFTFVFLSPSLIKVKTKNKAVLMCAYIAGCEEFEKIIPFYDASNRQINTKVGVGLLVF